MRAHAEPSAPSGGPGRIALHLLAAIGPVVLVSVSGASVTAPAIPDWYAGLAKAPLTPPNWVFPIAWTALYAVLALVAFRLLRLPAGTPGRQDALVAFYAQLALNAAWSWSFFGARSPILGLVNVLLLLCAIVWAMDGIGKVDRLGAWLLVPYAAWVAFATYLNATILWLNGA